MSYVASKLAQSFPLAQYTTPFQEHPGQLKAPGLASSTSSRAQHLRRIGVFEKIDGEYVGHIATLNFKCKAIIKENPYRKGPTEAEYIVVHTDAEVFFPELGFGWDKTTAGNQESYILVHLDDPGFSKTIVAVLVRGPQNYYYLFWDRITITDDDIERQVVTEEMIPYTGVLRRIAKVTQYLIQIYPSLREIWDPD